LTAFPPSVSSAAEMTARDTGDARPRQRLRPSGGYRQLRSFQAAEIVYDGTVSFCDRFVDQRSRTHDQMIQAARSGRQNIAEGSRAAATSSQTELRLTNVARASLDELLLDYQDYLRQRGLPMWDQDSPEATEVRAVVRTGSPDAAAYRPWLKHADPAVVANALICLIHQTNFLLDRQVASLERSFVKGGGYSEQLAAARLAERRRSTTLPSDPSDRSDPSDPRQRTPQAPTCPRCGGAMVLRTARQGPRAGSQFWGCSGYPRCRGTMRV